MTATLMGFFACGFLAAGLVSLFWFLVAALFGLGLLSIAMIVEGYSLLQLGEAAAASFALSQVGFGLGLAWVARSAPDQRRL